MSRKSEHLIKSRYGRVSTKKRFDEEFENALKESCDNIHRALGASSKKNISLPSTNNKQIHKINSLVNAFHVGDIVWAKTGKYPFWPGIVTEDPRTNEFSKKEENSIMLHIHYCNDAFRRNWLKLSQIFQFSSKNKILIENPKILTQISRSKLKQKWNRAVDEAECLTKMNKDIRVDAYFGDKFLPKTNLSTIKNFEADDTKRNKSNNAISKVTSSKQDLTQSHNSNSFKSTTTNYELKHKLNTSNKKRKLCLQDNFANDHPRILIPELCKLFYSNGWVTGTGGGISIKYNNEIFIAPSGVQKERMEPEDLFVQDINGIDIEVPPAEKNFSKSQCTPIFMCAYSKRNAGAVIHIHSQEVVKLCLLNQGNELKISGLEIIKGIYNEEKEKFYDNDEEVIIPIIENSKYERDLVDTFSKTLNKYPKTSAVLVRNHGMYVWGKDWKSAKTQCECYEYAFNIMVFKKIHNL